MARFSSPEVIVNKNAEEVFTQFSDMNNLKDILPPEIEDFESTVDSCSFKIKGMPKLNLEFAEKIPNSKISIKAKDSQAPFSLDCFIREKKDQCQVRLELNAEVNIMMQTMVEKPLTQFLNMLALKIQEL